jgi:hypothetical protein
MRATLAGLVLGAVVCLLGHGSASAQAGFYVTPSFSVSEEFDDNVFVSTTSPRSDFITRFTPGVELGYRSEPFTLLVSSSIDAEIYADNTELSDPANRKRAALALKYSPYRLLTLGLDVTYLDTQDPSQVVPLTGIQLGRRHATELLVSPTAVYNLTPTTTLRAGYSFEHDTVEGDPNNTSHRIRLGLAHQFAPTDTGLIGYRLGIYETEGFATTFVTNTPTVGWIHQFTPQTTLTVEGGPRFVTDGGTSVEPDVHARIEHQFRLFRAALDFLRTEAVVVGRPGIQELESVTGLIEAEPIRLLKVRFEPGYYRTFGGVDPTTRVYGFLLSALYPIRPWLSARLGYRFAYQEEGSEHLHRDIVTLGLDIAYPIRVVPW